jgi:hypothetical protein
MSALDWVFDAPESPRPVPHQLKSGDAWPRCGARTRKHGNPPCAAPGNGCGGRCKFHGGIPAHPREFALLPGPGWRQRGPEVPRAWACTLVPAALWRAATANGARDFESGLPYYFHSLRGKAKDDVRDVLYNWPALVGLTVATRLIERGRIAVAVVDSPRTAHKLRTARPSSCDDAAWERWLEEHIVLTNGGLS